MEKRDGHPIGIERRDVAGAAVSARPIAVGEKRSRGQGIERAQRARQLRVGLDDQGGRIGHGFRLDLPPLVARGESDLDRGEDDQGQDERRADQQRTASDQIQARPPP
jgi:hypothetical protein